MVTAGISSWLEGNDDDCPRPVNCDILRKWPVVPTFIVNCFRNRSRVEPAYSGSVRMMLANKTAAGPIRLKVTSPFTSDVVNTDFSYLTSILSERKRSGNTS